jgi:hypothetical protein
MCQQWRFGFSPVMKEFRYAMMNSQAISRVSMEFRAASVTTVAG